MEFKNLHEDDRAVSPVIGVILMVAITVILAAVIGTFVLGLGDQVQSTTPQASFGFDFEAGNDGTFSDTNSDSDTVTITHESGSSIEAGTLSVVVSGSNGFTVSDVTSGAHVNSGWSDPVSAGSSLVITETNSGTDYLQSGETIRVVYSSPDSDSTSTLASREIP